VVIAALCVLTWVQVTYWHDSGTVWERALAVTKDNYRAHVGLGNYEMDQGRLDSAADHYREAVRLRPNAPEMHYRFGVALLRLGRDAEAADQLQETVRRDPSAKDAWHHLGLARLRQGKPELAIPAFRRSLELRPGATDSLTGLGHALWQSGKREEAIVQFEAALNRDLGWADAWYGLGVAYLTRSELDKAAWTLDRVRETKPELVRPHSYRGVVFGRQGKWNEAVACQRFAIALQERGEQALAAIHGRPPAPDSIPQMVTLQCRLAFALHQRGDVQDAAEVYQAALLRDPDWPDKFTALARRLATGPDEMRDPRLAFELASQAVQAVSDPSAAMWDTLAAAAAAADDFPEAIRAAQRALDKASSCGDGATVRGLQERLQLYKEGKRPTAECGLTK
jgi:tetratricopeptide (TPR) repeat protein